nr:hypothetical protein [uncultured Roseateles sp.]
MSNQNLVQAALRRFFAPQHGLHRPWQALLPRTAAGAPQWADFADTQPGVFRNEALADPRHERECA